ncbi:hypothetical protein K469DRAFT_747392 [Zopfia rhizophila CBS 207.26]|uniref:DUF6594 domain-containing protein n=1 Tax=Zopfia rhizophila CBS 207.26 TaxID=1314779 RepID=A0A6A6EGF1_9PEZI|nr:hypothetical protein K469DRAFT_747392 [Zopfia rhizophila CBS 207.26]
MSGLRDLDSQGRDIERMQAPESHQPSNIDSISEAWEQYPEGYPRFAAFIAHDADKSTTIFRRFERLAARNLLYLEGELFELEAKQDKLDEDDWNDARLTRNLRKWEPTRTTREASQHTTDRQEATSSPKEIGISSPVSTAGIMNAAQQERLEVAYSIRRAINEYYKALKLYHEILSLDNPNPQALTTARLVLDNHLSNTGPAVQQDTLITVLEHQLEWIFRDPKHPHRNSALIRFPRRYMQTIVAGISLVIILLMFLGSLFALYYMRDGLTRLGLISCMTLFLALSMAVFTRSSRFEIFVAIIGYLLITTIFVGNSYSIPSPASYSGSDPFVQQISVPGPSSDDTTSAISAVTLTAIEVVGPTATTAAPSDKQSAALEKSASIATIAGSVIGGLALLFSIVAGLYKCRKWARERRTKKTSTP